jgi:hypothetical protein
VVMEAARRGEERRARRPRPPGTGRERLDVE